MFVVVCQQALLAAGRTAQKVVRDYNDETSNSHLLQTTTAYTQYAAHDNNHSNLRMGAPTPVITRDQVAARILAGDSLVILRNKVLRVPPSWLKAHPGGALAILHFVGRDATDEVEAFHTAETLEKMKGFVIGTVEVAEHGWEPFLPPVMSGWVRRPGPGGVREWYREADAFKSTVDTELYPSTDTQLVETDNTHQARVPTLEIITPAASKLSAKTQAEHSAAYKELHQRIIDAGLYKTRYLAGYGPEIVRYTLFAVVAAVAYQQDWLVLSAFSLGLFWHQVTFTAHDLGHMGVTHDWAIDRLLGIFIADFMGGLSIGWWVDVRTHILLCRVCVLTSSVIRTIIHIIVSEIMQPSRDETLNLLFNLEVVTNHPSQ